MCTYFQEASAKHLFPDAGLAGFAGCSVLLARHTEKCEVGCLLAAASALELGV